MNAAVAAAEAAADHNVSRYGLTPHTTMKTIVICQLYIREFIKVLLHLYCIVSLDMRIYEEIIHISRKRRKTSF
jgi:hypothetical protein